MPRRFIGAHPMHADSNLPRRMSRLARKLLGKRRREIDEIADEEDLDPLWLQEILCDSPLLPKWETNKEHGEYYQNHQGTLLRRWDGCTKKINLDLNETSTIKEE